MNSFLFADLSSGQRSGARAGGIHDQDEQVELIPFSPARGDDSGEEAWQTEARSRGYRHGHDYGGSDDERRADLWHRRSSSALPRRGDKMKFG